MLYYGCSFACARRQVGSLPALVAAAVAIGFVAGDDQLRQAVDASLVSPNTYGSAGFVVGIAALAIIMELLFIIVRICNIGLLNLKVKIFLIIVSMNACMEFAGFQSANCYRDETVAYSYIYT